MYYNVLQCTIKAPDTQEHIMRYYITIITAYYIYIYIYIYMLYKVFTIFISNIYKFLIYISSTIYSLKVLTTFYNICMLTIWSN